MLSKAEACAKTICCLSAASSNRQFDERYFLAKFYPDSGRDEFWLPTYPLNCSLNNCRVSKQRTHKYHLRKKIKRKKLLQSDSYRIRFFASRQRKCNTFDRQKFKTN